MNDGNSAERERLMGMSDAVVNKRLLAETVQKLIKTNSPDLPEMQAAANALAQVFSDITGVDVQLVMRMRTDQLVDRFGNKDA